MLTDRHNPSPSPTRASGFFASIGAAFNRSLSGDRYRDAETSSTTTMINTQDYANRSQSRGRDGFTSSGRGGLGNIRQTSVSRTRPDSGPDDFSSSRGREHAVDPTRVYSTGRGGAGNIRSPSRDVRSPPLGPDIHEQEVVENYLSTHRDTPHSTGRGGLGNMTSRSQSRGPSTPGVVHSTGRGGAGNIVPGDAAHAEVADEAERRKISGVYDREGVHSTGRGGAANFTTTHEPAVEHHPHHHQAGEWASTGRGGAGNIVVTRD